MQIYGVTKRNWPTLLLLLPAACLTHCYCSPCHQTLGSNSLTGTKRSPACVHTYKHTHTHTITHASAVAYRHRTGHTAVVCVSLGGRGITDNRYKDINLTRTQIQACTYTHTTTHASAVTYRHRTGYTAVVVCVTRQQGHHRQMVQRDYPHAHTHTNTHTHTHKHTR